MFGGDFRVKLPETRLKLSIRGGVAPLPEDLEPRQPLQPFSPEVLRRMGEIAAKLREERAEEEARAEANLRLRRAIGLTG